MQPPNNIVLIRQGATSLTALAERLVNVAFQHGWIDQNEYLTTRITREPWNSNLPSEQINPLNKLPLKLQKQ